MVPSIPKEQRTLTVRAICESLQESEKPECALEESAQLLSKAEEQVLGGQVAELADLVDVVATPEPETAL
jgi:hypothetical protein